MALDTYAEIVGRVKLHCPAAGELLARDWVTNAFRRVAERKRWSWLVKTGQFILPPVVNDGTATVTNSSTTVTGNGTAWTGDLAGRQFRIGNSTPIYTIASVTDASTLELDQFWGAASQTDVQYQIYLAFQTAPSDFHSFISLWDPQQNWALHLNVSAMALNIIDPQRTNSGTSYCAAWHDWNTVDNLPRYELWPHNITSTGYVYPFLYEVRADNLTNPSTVIPRYVREDVLLEMALSQAARWPGTSTEPNPYFNRDLSTQLERRAEFMIGEMERQDDETFLQSVTYPMRYAPWPFPDAPFPLDAQWMQSHSI